MNSVTEIASFLAKGRYRLGSESQLQMDIAARLEACGVPFQREVRLGKDDRIDFIAESTVGIEVKTRAIKRHIFRQLSRYAEYDQLSGLILISNTPIGLPQSINGKPMHLVSLGRCLL